MEKDYTIAPTTVGKLMQEYSNKSISKKAKYKCVEELELLCKKITKKAMLYAMNENRKTIKKKDVIYAYQQLKLDGEI